MDINQAEKLINNVNTTSEIESIAGCIVDTFVKHGYPPEV